MELDRPTIDDYTNATHFHTSAVDGGIIVIPNPTLQGLRSVTGLKIMNSINTPNERVVVTANEIQLSDPAYDAKTIRNLNVDIFTGQTGAGGVDTGIISGSTWWAIYVIYNPTSLVVEGIMSTQSSPENVTLPSGYTYISQRLGWVRTDASGSAILLRLLGRGNSSRYIVTPSTNTPNLPMIASGVAGSWNAIPPTWVAIPTGNFVPPTASKINILVYPYNCNVLIAPNPNSLGGTPNPATNPSRMLNAAYNNTEMSLLLESSNIYWACNGAGGSVWCIGWEDNI